VNHDGGSNLVATGFKWGLEADLSDATDVATTMASDSTFTAELTGLTPNTTYYFTAYSTNASRTDYGTIVRFETPCDPVPSDVQGCDAGAITSLNYQGYDYRLVEINGRCWFAENLRTENYNDGTTPIPSGLSDDEWSATQDGAVTVVDEGGTGEGMYLAQNGRLYNWHAVNTGNLCPTGWHVPTDDEFTDLSNYLGGDSVAGRKMKAADCWTFSSGGTNESGFSAVNGGQRGYNDGLFGNILTTSYFWSSTYYFSNLGWARRMGENYEHIIREVKNSKHGLSVRCVQDPMTETIDATDRGYETGTLQGKVLHDGGSNVVATGFKWGLQPDLSDATVITTTMAADSTFTAVLTGLADGTTYYYTTFATNAVRTDYATPLSFTTACISVPSDIQGCDNGALTSVNYQGYDYQLVEINGECWFAENLRSENYNDDTPIPTTQNGEIPWWNLPDGGVTVHDEGGADESFNLLQYGRLYNWYAVNTGDLCPTGWHVPTDEEFAALATYLGGVAVAGGKMKSSVCWNGSNESDFSGIGGGYRQDTGGFRSIEEGGYFWTSSITTVAYPWARPLYSDSQEFNPTDLFHKRTGLSIRCVQDPD